MSDEEFVKNAERWRDLGLAAHVHYPAPRVAYVKTLSDGAAATRVTVPGYVEVPMTLFTLRFIAGTGWRIFSIGWATRMDMIPFPEGDLRRDIRSVESSDLLSEEQSGH